MSKSQSETPTTFEDIYNVDSLTLIGWYNTVSDPALSDYIESEMTHRDLDGDKAAECRWLEANSSVGWPNAA